MLAVITRTISRNDVANGWRVFKVDEIVVEQKNLNEYLKECRFSNKQLRIVLKSLKGKQKAIYNRSNLKNKYRDIFVIELKEAVVRTEKRFIGGYFNGIAKDIPY